MSTQAVRNQYQVQEFDQVVIRDRDGAEHPALVTSTFHRTNGVFVHFRPLARGVNADQGRAVPFSATPAPLTWAFPPAS